MDIMERYVSIHLCLYLNVSPYTMISFMKMVPLRFSTRISTCLESAVINSIHIYLYKHLALSGFHDNAYSFNSDRTDSHLCVV